MIDIGIVMTEGQDIVMIEIETEIVDPKETGTISMKTGEI
jgi:hypothetical protein